MATQLTPDTRAFKWLDDDGGWHVGQLVEVLDDDRNIFMMTERGVNWSVEGWELSDYDSERDTQ